jgi:hypothetical protein
MNKVDIDPTVAGPETEPFEFFIGEKWTLPEISFREKLQRGLLNR